MSAQTGTSPADYIARLERQHRAQLLGLGAIALEMHQEGRMDTEKLMRLASRVAELERRLPASHRGS
jgi:hypothetical protein